ncbi:MAG: hypothetical protein KGD70_03225 [Candidatus Lokiarchaeota archaeon]|nr:hypothetical protein [Candidatus Lokiarchaeota archaeon]
MSHKSYMNRRKLMVNNIVGVSIVIVIFAQLMFFRLIAIMSIVVYPMALLVPYGVYMVYKIIVDSKITLLAKIIKLAFTVAYTIFSMIFLNMLFSYPHITLRYIIYFLSIPTSIIGLAGFLKGLMIDVYSPLFRFLNFCVGMFTVFYTFIAIMYADYNFVIHLITLSTMLSLNGILRLALYLSEYGLKLNKMKSFRIAFYIMESNLTIKSIEENQI